MAAEFSIDIVLAVVNPTKQPMSPRHAADARTCVTKACDVVSIVPKVTQIEIQPVHQLLQSKTCPVRGIAVANRGVP